MHHNLGTEEPPLVTASEISKDLVVSVLTDEEGEISTTLVLHILLKCFSCGLISIHQQPHCTVDRDHVLELLFIVLEIYEDIEQFWKDWEINERFVKSRCYCAISRSTYSKIWICTQNNLRSIILTGPT